MTSLAVFPGQRKVSLVHMPSPALAHASEVKVRMLEVGICGTDREIGAFEYGHPPPGSEFLVLGHESLGQVVEVGSAVTRCRPGDLVVVTVRRPCPHRTCMACRTGRQDFCFTGDFVERGISRAHGFLTPLVIEDERYLTVVPPALRDVGVLVEPLSIAEKALTQIWQVQERLPWACPIVPGQAPVHCRAAVVLGAGPIGLLGAMVLVAAGFRTYVYSREDVTSNNAAIAEAIGATYVCSKDESIQEFARRLQGIDLVYEAVGAAPFAFQVLRELGPCGMFIFTGVPGRKGAAEVDVHDIMRNLVLKNQVVLGTVNAGLDAYERAVADLAAFMGRWPDAVRRLITGRHSVEAGVEVVSRGMAGIKHVIYLG